MKPDVGMPVQFVEGEKVSAAVITAVLEADAVNLFVFGTEGGTFARHEHVVRHLHGPMAEHLDGRGWRNISERGAILTGADSGEAATLGSEDPTPTELPRKRK